MDIEHLISQYIDGDLSSDAEAEMHHLLSVSPDARALFRAQLALRDVAHDPRVLVTPSNDLRRNLFDRLEREGMSASALPPRTATPAPVSSTVERSIPSSRFEGTAFRRRRRAFAWALVPIALLILVVGGKYFVDRDDNMGIPVLSDHGAEGGLTRPGDLGRQPSSPTDVGSGTVIEADGQLAPRVERAEGTGQATSAITEDRHRSSPKTGARRSRRSRPSGSGPDHAIAVPKDDIDGVEGGTIASVLSRPVPSATPRTEAPVDGGGRADESVLDVDAPALPRHRSTTPPTVRRDLEMSLTPTDPDMIPRIASDQRDSTRFAMAEQVDAEEVRKADVEEGRGTVLANMRGERSASAEGFATRSQELSLGAFGATDQNGGGALLGKESESKAQQTDNAEGARPPQDAALAAATTRSATVHTRDSDRRVTEPEAVRPSTAAAQTVSGIVATTAAGFVHASNALARTRPTQTMSK